MSDSNLSSPDLIKTSPKVSKHWGHTQSNLHNIHFTWTINNFSLTKQKPGEVLQSPTFYADTNDEVKWELRLYPNGQNEQTRGFLSLYLYLLSLPRNESQVIGKYKMYILNDKRDDATSSELKTMGEFSYFTSGTSLGHSRFIQRSILLDETSGLLPEDKLIIVCEISFASNIVNISSQKDITQFAVPQCNVSDDLSVLLDNPKFSDITLVVGEHEFQAHKAILAVRSDVFAAMFEHDMAESNSGRVIITVVNCEVLQEMLRFIYTGDAPKVKEMSDQLLAAADKYALKKLKFLAEQAMFAELSILTAAETLALADLYNAHQLREQTINFIKIHAKEIIQTDGWKNMIRTNINSPLRSTTFDALLTPK